MVTYAIQSGLDHKMVSNNGCQIGVRILVLVDESVTLDDVDQQHAGIYQCLAHNDVASVVTAGARLRVTAVSHSHQHQQQQQRQQSLNTRGQPPHHSLRPVLR